MPLYGNYLNAEKQNLNFVKTTLKAESFILMLFRSISSDFNTIRS